VKIGYESSIGYSWPSPYLDAFPIRVDVAPLAFDDTGDESDIYRFQFKYLPHFHLYIYIKLMGINFMVPICVQAIGLNRSTL